MPRFATTPTLLKRTAASLIVVAGLATATLLVAPPASSAQPGASYPRHGWDKTPAERAETLQQRIRTLHASLRITPAEEAHWSGVAQAMRDNENRLQAMIAARETATAHHVTAPEQLRSNERFTQAHVAGLQALRGAFETLYAAMPDDQKLIADDVFDTVSHGHD